MVIKSKTKTRARPSRTVKKVNYKETALAKKATTTARKQREKQEMSAFDRSHVGRLTKRMSKLMGPTKKNTIQHAATKRAALLRAARTKKHKLYEKQARYAFGKPTGVKTPSPTPEDDDMANLLDQISKLGMRRKRSRKHKKKSRKHKKH